MNSTVWSKRILQKISEFRILKAANDQIILAWEKLKYRVYGKKETVDLI